MVDQEYINPFVHVHRKVKIFKDHLREASKGDAELRENRAMQETKENGFSFQDNRKPPIIDHM